MAALTALRTVDGTRKQEHVDFEVSDQRGRAIGALVDTRLVTFIALPADATNGYRHPAGTFYALCIQATRNGRPYGAGQPHRYFANEAERTTARTASLAASRRRATHRRVKP